LNLLPYTHVFYMIIVWAFIFLYIKPKRLKELLPVGFLSLLLVFLIDIYLITLNLYQLWYLHLPKHMVLLKNCF
jgi:hypothetical protein